MIQIPLRDRSGQVRAHALIDDGDCHLALCRWSLHSEDGYVGRKSGRQTILLHREVCKLVPGDGLEADHVDGNKLDNRRSNLRVATRRTNGQNRSPSGNTGSASKYRGVSWDKSRSRWYAYIMVGGKQRCLGRFDDEDEAGRIAAKARNELMTHSSRELIGSDSR